MYCPKCGATNDDSTAFCAACGTDLSAYRGQPAGPGPAATPAQPAYQSPVQQAPQYQQPPYQQQYQQQYQQAAQYPPIGRGVVPRVPSYMGWAIAVLILCFWPTGIVAVVNASRVGNRLALGDIAGAQESSRKAKMWCWITFIVAIVWVAFVIIMYALVWNAAVNLYY